MERSRCHLRLGAQAKCSVLLSKLHPSAVVDAHFPNLESQKCLKDLIAVRIDDATHGGCTMKSVFFTSPSIPNEELYCSKKFCIILREGPADFLFEDEAINASNFGEEEDSNEIDQAVFRVGNWTKDIEFVRNQGLLVDNDNDLAPETVPQQQMSFASLFDGQC